MWKTNRFNSNVDQSNIHKEAHAGVVTIRPLSSCMHMQQPLMDVVLLHSKVSEDGDDEDTSFLITVV